MTMMHVDPGDPHNDQVLAQTAEDYKNNMLVVRDVIRQAEEQDAPLSSILAVVSVAYVNNEHMTRERMASLLALSLVRNHAKNEFDELSDYLKKIVRG